MENPPRVLKTMDAIVHWVEVVAAGLLAVLSAVGVGLLVYEMVLAATQPSAEEIERMFSAILLVFILLELYSMARAFIEGGNVMNKVFEVGLVALVRQVIVAELLHLEVTQLLTIAALIVSLGVAWFLSRRGQPTDDTVRKRAA